MRVNPTFADMPVRGQPAGCVGLAAETAQKKQKRLSLLTGRCNLQETSPSAKTAFTACNLHFFYMQISEAFYSHVWLNCDWLAGLGMSEPRVLNICESDQNIKPSTNVFMIPTFPV